MVSTAQTILLDKRKWDASQVAYLVSAGMLGHLAQGNQKKASQLWAKYGNQLEGLENPALLFQLLVAHSMVGTTQN